MEEKMENTECEVVKGVYLSNYKTDRPNCDGFCVDSVDSGSVYIFMSYTDEVDKYHTLKEDDLKKVAKKLFPDKEIDPKELFSRTFFILGYRNKKLEGAKYKKNDGTFKYMLRYGCDVYAIPFLHKQDLSFENPKDIEIIKSYQGLEWPNFSADQTKLANLMQAKGYPVKHYGRSGFESRNSYWIEMPDTPEENIIEVIAKIKQDIADAKEELNLKELAQADKEFAENILDKDGIFSYLELGGGPSHLHHYNQEKYQEIGSERISCCQDSRRNISHMYRTLLFDKEKLKKKLEENEKNFEEKTKKQTERIKNLFKDSAIVRLDEKKMINDWIDPYSEKNITSELLFRTSVDGDRKSTRLNSSH